MWSLGNLKDYLSQHFGQDDVWQRKLLPQLKDIIRISMLSAWSTIEWRDNSLGIYGYDVIVDSDLRMWLLEVNLCPTMEHSTRVTAHLVPRMMEDLCKVVIDGAPATGDFELIYEGGQRVSTKEAIVSELSIEGRRI